jgi:transposase-like protein
MVSAMSMYVAGISLSQLGRWFGGKAKSTIYNWIMGLALALWLVIQGWLRTRLKTKKLYIDEKWLKIKKRWHYWFVGVDVETELPVFHDVLPTRTKWACRVFLLKLKRWGQNPSMIITDGLKAYESAIAWVYPSAKHLLCLFHHQQGVTRYVKKHMLKPMREEEALKNDKGTRETKETKETKDAKEAKRLMKNVTQTTDPRTVKRRLEHVEKTAERKGWNLKTWLKQTRRNLSKLLPSLRKNTYPTTTNGIERFFRAFTRFYKNRGGFHSVLSTTRELKLFLVVYLFTIQPESGHAPIEKIVPEANMMPFYKILNNPLTSMRAVRTSLPPPDVKPGENLATEPVKEAA